MPFIKIIRPINCLFVALTTILGFAFLNDFLEINNFLYIIFATISAFFIAAAGYTINDYYDYEIDKINKPNRPLPKGDITLDTARMYGIYLFIIGCILSLFTMNYFCILIAVLNSIALYFYAKLLKKNLIIGNLLVAWNTCSTFIYGAILSSNLKNILPLICFSFLYTIIREWVKIIEDYDGDKKEKVKSIAIILGKQKTIYLIVFVAIILISSIFFFYIKSFMEETFFIVLLLLIFIPLTILIISLYRSMNKFTAEKIQRFMKLNMLSVVCFYIIYDILTFRIIRV